MAVEIEKNAQAGTLQSSDLLVVVEPAGVLSIEIESTVEQQFGHLIRARVDDVLQRLGVARGRVMITDRGALDYAIEARVETAVKRAIADRSKTQ